MLRLTGCLPLQKALLFFRQTGEPGGEAEGMGSQESAGGGGEARLLHGALPRPRAPTGSQPHQQPARHQWQQCQRLLQVPVPDKSLDLKSHKQFEW